MSVSLPGIALMGGGLLLTFSAVEDVEGGPIGAVRALLTGNLPTSGAQKSTSVSNALQSVIGQVQAQAAGKAAGNAVGAIQATGDRGKVISTAQTYLGVPYRFGGASRSGVDCSGLVMLAYASIGVKLPHKASLQAAKGVRISRSEIQQADLVAWGAPGNYPHIALAMDQDTVIVAPHTGSHVMYQKLWQKKVPGFGYPDIYRILK